MEMTRKQIEGIIIASIVYAWDGKKKSREPFVGELSDLTPEDFEDPALRHYFVAFRAGEIGKAVMTVDQFNYCTRNMEHAGNVRYYALELIKLSRSAKA